jgi:hypothetical protein
MGPGHLARVRSKVEFLKLINWKIAWGAHNGVNPRRCVGDEGVRLAS